MRALNLHMGILSCRRLFHNAAHSSGSEAAFVCSAATLTSTVSLAPSCPHACRVSIQKPHGIHGMDQIQQLPTTCTLIFLQHTDKMQRRTLVSIFAPACRSFPAHGFAPRRGFPAAMGIPGHRSFCWHHTAGCRQGGAPCGDGAFHACVSRMAAMFSAIDIWLISLS